MPHRKPQGGTCASQGGMCALEGGTCASHGGNCGSLLYTFASYKETISKPEENLYFRVHFTKIVPRKIFCALPSDGWIPALSDSLHGVFQGPKKLLHNICTLCAMHNFW